MRADGISAMCIQEGIHEVICKSPMRDMYV